MTHFLGLNPKDANTHSQYHLPQHLPPNCKKLKCEEMVLWRPHPAGQIIREEEPTHLLLCPLVAHCPPQPKLQRCRNGVLSTEVSRDRTLRTPLSYLAFAILIKMDVFTRQLNVAKRYFTKWDKDIPFQSNCNRAAITPLSSSGWSTVPPWLLG